ncbi:xanthine dehydrogenase, molybdenum binding subunit [Agrobacterium tumefaciens str. Cherry 2E-2-2]|nr:xanthine dehydrogenase, molybdenum binding subunit [Agrobacterium tumefaciens str. Cherry 2E-2-2]
MIVTCVLGTAKQPTPLDRLVDIAVYDPVHHFGGRDVIPYHQAIAVVVADSFETARAAANLLIVNYEVDGSASFDLSAHAGAGEFEPRVAVGDFEAAFRDAPVKLDKTYTTPAESHAMMEPRATLASWDDDRITLWTSDQMITWSAQSIAKAFSIPPEMSGWTLPISAVALARNFRSSRCDPGRACRTQAGPPGQGVAGAYRGSPVLMSGARVTLKPDASVVVASDMTDIGTGSYTIMAQTAAQRGDCRGTPPASRSACGSRGARLTTAPDYVLIGAIR